MKSHVRSVQAAVFAVAYIVVVGCRIGDHIESEAKVVNGLAVPADEYSPVVQLKDDLGRPFCTATFVGTHTALTAAHCTSARLNFEGTEPGLVIRYASYGDPAERSDELDVHDLAVLVFQTVSEEHPLALAKTLPQVGDQLKYVGYGCKNNNGTGTGVGIGVKRAGTNEYQGIDGTVVHKGMLKLPVVFKSDSHPDGTNADACAGDSGGPVLFKGRLVGTVSGANVAHSLQTNLLEESNVKFLKQANGKGADIPGVGQSTKSDLMEILADGDDTEM